MPIIYKSNMHINIHAHQHTCTSAYTTTAVHSRPPSEPKHKPHNASTMGVRCYRRPPRTPFWAKNASMMGVRCLSRSSMSSSSTCAIFTQNSSHSIVVASPCAVGHCLRSHTASFSCGVGFVLFLCKWQKDVYRQVQHKYNMLAQHTTQHPHTTYNTASHYIQYTHPFPLPPTQPTLLLNDLYVSPNRTHPALSNNRSGSLLTICLNVTL